jgi:hypothetical protein
MPHLEIGIFHQAERTGISPDLGWGKDVGKGEDAKIIHRPRCFRVDRRTVAGSDECASEHYIHDRDFASVLGDRRMTPVSAAYPRLSWS